MSTAILTGAFLLCLVLAIYSVLRRQASDGEEHLSGIANSVPALIAYVNAHQRYEYVNDLYKKYFAPHMKDIRGHRVQQVLGPERYAMVAQRIESALEGQLQHYDWMPFPDTWLGMQYVPRLGNRDEVIGYYVVGSDISERKRAEDHIQDLNSELARRIRLQESVSRALTTLSAGNRALLRATDEQSLLDSMCQAIVKVGGYAMAIVCYANDDKDKTLRTMAECGHSAGMEALRAIKNSWADNEYGRGPMARAIRTGTVCAIQNLHADPNYSAWRTDMADYAAGIAFPLKVLGETIGGIGIYASQPDAFGPDEEKLLTELAADLAYGLTSLRERIEKEKIENAMHLLTSYDALTGLPNSSYFTELLNGAIHSSHAKGHSFALIQTNIERLSEINDALGFHQGDVLLREFADRLRSAAANSAMVARLRGDEFAVLIPECDESSAILMGQQLQQAFSGLFLVADIPLELSARIGIALYPQHGTNPHDLYRNVDIAVHQAKKRGVGLCVCSPPKARDQSRRLTLAGELRRAIDEGDLRIYLQPKIHMASGQVRGAEALVRWKHTKHGLIPPGEFVDLAEHTGLIKPLTDWVIEAVLDIHQDWNERGCAIPIAVNISARNLHDEDFENRLHRLQSVKDVPVGLLEMEVTESVIMEDAEFSLRVLHGLRNQGIPLYIDDFGTGYSSLSYLQKMPVDYLKIDQSFVRNITASKESSLIVRSTIELAHDIGLMVVAEGVETQEHWDLLAQFKCDFSQGYFIARPMPAAEFQEWAQLWDARRKNS